MAALFILIMLTYLNLAITQDDSGSNSSTMFLNIGLSIGVLLRTVMDSVTGELSDTRTRYFIPISHYLVGQEIKQAVKIRI